MDFFNFTIRQIHNLLKNKEISAKEITKAYLEKIEKTDNNISAFLDLFQESALKQAEAVDKDISSGREIGLLEGIPYAVKDNILVKDFKCSAASKILENYIASYDATVIEKLNKEKAVVLGKTNLDEFAMGSSTEHSAFKTTKNPNDLSRVPGGSSGGSAAAVAAKEAVFALGSDTGGSIRQPASFCGVVGLKPTYGSVSRFGLIAFASSLDQIGPIAKNVEDCKIVFETIKGKDEKDATSVDYDFFQRKEEGLFDPSKVKVGVPKEYFGQGIDLQVRQAIEKAIKRLEGNKVKIEEISLPHSKYALAAYYLISTSEASANLARYDGIRYGKRFSGNSDFPENKELLDIYLKTRETGFGSEVKRRIMLGTYSLSAGYYQAYYLKAQKVRTLIKNEFEETFKKFDFIITPTSPYTAFKIGEKINDPLKMYLSDIYTVPVNLAGMPALSLPCGMAGNLPVGLQIISKAFSEDKLFKMAEFMEKEIV